MHTDTTTLRFTERLGEPAPDPARLGGKGASLSRLVGLGHRVPPGFVVTVPAFDSTIAHLGLAEILDGLQRSMADPDRAGIAGERIRTGLSAGRLPGALLEQVLLEVADLGLWDDNDAGLIVRSSATSEDTAALSFAGIFESIPVTAPELLEPTIREVWASGFSPRALAYVRESGLGTVPPMAVVIQRFIAADRSGVMFTRFAGPDGAPRILIEHVEGACEKLVRGEVTPDRLWLERFDQVPEGLAGPLTARHAGQLGRLAADLEEVFGWPQDVEWLIHADAVHLVQSRPITAGMAGPVAGDTRAGAAMPPLLAGVGASPGVGSGAVHLVFNIDQALALERGHVLVTPMTNPDMVVAMRNSAAIVTDVGGIICHAAIVSRELGLPCVVGTETGTTTLAAGQVVTVDGSAGLVYPGEIRSDVPATPTRPIDWADLWAMWEEAASGGTARVPLLSAAAALESMPPSVAWRRQVVLVPDPDLRCDPQGLWRDLEGMPGADRARVVDAYVARVRHSAGAARVDEVLLAPLGTFPASELARAIERSGPATIRLLPAREAIDAIHSPGTLSLGAAALVRAGGVPAHGTVAQSLSSALDTLKFFGHQPGVRVTGMPDPSIRGTWWARLPEYARYHAEFGTTAQQGEFEWLEVRPELVISALLKSLVQPGFEMAPRVLGFTGVAPMHIKWIRCRYHFRADTFATVWQEIVRHSYDQAWMADLMRRVRWSYRYLEEVLRLFPATDDDLAAITGERIVSLLTAWWPRWIEFFSLCWFIQAQGDDIAYPFVQETVEANLAAVGAAPQGRTWPSGADFIAPTTPVMSGAYMADVGTLREMLLAAGLRSKADAEAALARGEHPAIAAQVQEHLRTWHWMRDRDLLFEPWDTPARVIETALKTEPHALSPYEANLRRNLLALSFHTDLALLQDPERAVALNHHARFLHDLNVERENHHILWLKYSYPLRRLFLEVERRLVVAGSLDPGDVFFLQAPELLDAAANLPSGLPDDLVARVKNRRAGFEFEARLAPEGSAEADPEDDYY
jgi:phosphohistidine swiveling domain-containing protein